MQETFAPSWVTWRRRLPFGIALLVVLLVLDYFRLQQPLLVYIAEFGSLIVLAVVYTLLYFRNTRVEVDRLSVTKTNAFGRRRAYDDTDIGSVVLVDNYTYQGQSGQSAPRLFVLDKTGHAILRWDARIWPLPEMLRLTGALALPVTSIPVSTTQDFAKQYPHALASIEQHPVKWGLGMSLVIVVVVIAVVTAVVFS